MDRFLSGGRSKDPLYLSNQSLWRKSSRVILILFPLLVVAVVIALFSFKLILKQTAPAREPTAAEVAARLPDFRELKIGENPDVTLLEAEIRTEGAARIVFGRVRNNTSRHLAQVQLVFSVTDSRGSQLGAEAVTVEDVGPRSIRPFQYKSKFADAVIAIVRETHTR
jgi:hypothetical protein